MTLGRKERINKKFRHEFIIGKNIRMELRDEGHFN